MTTLQAEEATDTESVEAEDATEGKRHSYLSRKATRCLLLFRR